MRNLAKRLGFLGQKMAGAAFEEPIVFRYARVTGTLVVLGNRQRCMLNSFLLRFLLPKLL
jgi:hypothetical protein